MANQAISYPKAISGARPISARRVLGPDWVLAWLFIGPAVLIITALLIYWLFCKPI